MIAIEVVYALPEHQQVLNIDIAPGTTAKQALQQTQLQQDFPRLDVDTSAIGVFGQPISLEYVMQDGDRLEIYRPLLRDPMEARRKRVKFKPRKGHHLYKQALR